jgi:hypothetical protein
MNNEDAKDAKQPRALSRLLALGKARASIYKAFVPFVTSW